MPPKGRQGATKKVRRKEKKNVAHGHAHIKSTFNNTIVSITDPSGNVISWASAGHVGFKGSRKSTPFAAQMAAESAARRAQEHGMRKVDVFVKGPGSGRETAIRSLQATGLEVGSIQDVTPTPHNGCRPRSGVASDAPASDCSTGLCGRYGLFSAYRPYPCRTRTLVVRVRHAIPVPVHRQNRTAAAPHDSKTLGASNSGRPRLKDHHMLIAQRPSLTEEVVDEYRSRFVIEPLEPGFGYTLGNSLRRTLLSSIPGAAVTSIRVDGVLHEFTTVPGVKEDVTDLILNIKQLVVSSEHDEPVVMYLRKQGPGLVTAADIAPPAGVEVHNPDLVLATLNGKGKLEMELTVERGRGYVSAVQNKQLGQEIGRIPVDSIYSPVLKVTYKVEATRVEQRTDFDKLIVDVETKQAMRPRDAMASAGKTLVELFGLARELNIDAEGIDMGPSPTDAALAADLALPIEELELTVRSYNCLKREGIHSVGELVARSEADLLDIRNFGAKSIDEVKAKLAGMGLALKDSPPGFDPTAAADAFGADDDADAGFVETEQY